MPRPSPKKAHVQRAHSQEEVAEKREVNETGVRLIQLAAEIQREKTRKSPRKGVGDLKKIDALQEEHEKLKKRHAAQLLREGSGGNPRKIPRST
jgi:hypothetical protein